MDVVIGYLSLRISIWYMSTHIWDQCIIAILWTKTRFFSFWACTAKTFIMLLKHWNIIICVFEKFLSKLNDLRKKVENLIFCSNLSLYHWNTWRLILQNEHNIWLYVNGTIFEYIWQNVEFLKNVLHIRYTRVKNISYFGTRDSAKWSSIPELHFALSLVPKYDIFLKWRCLIYMLFSNIFWKSCFSKFKSSMSDIIDFPLHT